MQYCLGDIYGYRVVPFSHWSRIDDDDYTSRILTTGSLGHSHSNSYISSRSGSAYGSHSSSGSSYGEPCCPLVVDPLLLIGILGFIAAATYFLRGRRCTTFYS